MTPKKKNQRRTQRNDHGQKEHVFSLVVVTRESRKEAEREAKYLLQYAEDGYEFKLRRGQPK